MIKKRFIPCIFLFITFAFLVGVPNVSAQKLKYSAEKLKGRRTNNERITELVGNVKYTQKETIIYCDSSIFFRKRNFFEAFGNVKIQDGDSVTITADSLAYDGAKKNATLTGNVVYTSGFKKLYTDELDYNVALKISFYEKGGRLIDEQNDLTSKIGYYYGFDDIAVFYDSVKLIAETYTLTTDTLRYKTVPKIAYTDGPTTIVTNSGNVINNVGGEYETLQERTTLVEGQIETEDYFLVGKELFLDDFQEYYLAKGDVKLISKNDSLVITGDEGYYDKRSGFSKVYGNPVMEKLLEVDTFFMSADTMVAIEAPLEEDKRILGYSDVRIFKSNLQGITDSISYFLADSMIVMYEDPVLWTNKNQISSDTVSLLINEKNIDKMNLYRNSFMVSQDTLAQFNQIKGRNMEAIFLENEIKNINVFGNGESIYFSLSSDMSYTIGMSKVAASNIKMLFKFNELSDIKYYGAPEGKIIPPHELTPAEQQLQGFSWRNNERPTLEYVLQRPEKVTEKEIKPLENPSKGKPQPKKEEDEEELELNGSAIRGIRNQE